MSHARDSQSARKRVRLTVRGRVQGVGFRPAVYRAMTERGCAGSVRNTPGGAVVEAEADASVLDGLVRDFARLLPPRARVDEMRVEELPPRGERGFRIEASQADGQSLLPIPPDLALCAACRADMDAGASRRAGYSFTTCTDCGPRFTIARQVPFDRPTNTMDEFPPCEACRREYGDPGDRRFHAQTISCPACGPSLAFLTLDGETLPDPLGRARRLLRDGGILAVKGVGGFHLACDALREDVVLELRRRKARPAKPFAIMAADLDACRRFCCVSDAEAELLTSPQAPIVLLRRRPDCPVADGVAPGLHELGVMLPYAPLHALLFGGDMPDALVMTSCNRSEEPISLSERDVLADLRDLVDGVLTHNRRIAHRCDDSLVAVFGGRPLPMRRSRGYAPEPILLDAEGPSVLAVGGMLKNAFAVTNGRRAFLSQHIGDVSDADNAAYFAESVDEFLRLLRLEPEVVACDVHPDYPTTHYARDLARRRGLPLVQVQHHHAHIVSCLAEHGHGGPLDSARDKPVIGVSWDGTGYGEDGAVWGGEFLIADRAAFERRHHLDYVPMPGGEQAVHEPWRMALSHLARALGPEEAVRRVAPSAGEGTCRRVLHAMEMAEFSPPTSSAGRLFDAVAALLGICVNATYEAQPACELEAECLRSQQPGESGLRGSGSRVQSPEFERRSRAMPFNLQSAICNLQSYPFAFSGPAILLSDMWRSICADVDAGMSAAEIAARFHRTMAEVILETCRRLRSETGLATVAMSGGVMQNRLLLGLAVPALRAEGFDVLLQTQVPPNDGGLCLGQAACALARLAGGWRSVRT